MTSLNIESRMRERGDAAPRRYSDMYEELEASGQILDDFVDSLDRIKDGAIMTSAFETAISEISWFQDVLLQIHNELEELKKELACNGDHLDNHTT